jgi:hypothetical protein
MAAPTFVSAARATGPYDLMAAPTLYSGQTVKARISADESNDVAVDVRLYIQTYGSGDELETQYGPEAPLAPASQHEFAWQIPEMGGAPIAAIGVEVRAVSAVQGAIYLDLLTWDGAPRVTFRRPATGGTTWSRAWVSALDQVGPYPEWHESFCLIQNDGRGLLMTGTREWADYQVGATLSPHMVAACGLAARVQGLRRYYPLILHQDWVARLIKALDGETILAETQHAWEYGRPYELHLALDGARIRARVDGVQLFDVFDGNRSLTRGGIALVCEEGRVTTDSVMVAPLAG